MLKCISDVQQQVNYVPMSMSVFNIFCFYLFSVPYLRPSKHRSGNDITAHNYVTNDFIASVLVVVHSHLHILLESHCHHLLFSLVNFRFRNNGQNKHLNSQSITADFKFITTNRLHLLKVISLCTDNSDQNTDWIYPSF